MFSLPAAITVLAVAGLASASSAGTPTDRRLNPAPADMAHTTPRGYIHARSAPATNARRFSQGLPPLAPRHHRVGVAARTASSPVPPTTQTCNIAVQSYDQTFGYLSATWNGFGEYGQFQAGQAGSLEVTFSYTPDSSSQLNFVATNSPSPTYPYFGAISGFASVSDDFCPGSYNYAYLGGTTSTPAGSPPWINTDGTAPATHIVYANDSNQALALTGSVTTFQDTFGAAYPEVTFTCVPPPSIAVDVSATVE
ncbi:hypothetical protein DFH08DRAFT_967833 [Mycena albidolilacea]|uniref:Uncharacterized protein n=1 Tax=Mycena albidolilacea TaxID=1033008 RepID=A0AAD7EIC1_9AGAR|nr:hypothetical protein DFH08DRAFT_967833 [Mycena albidolilacea]